jgi:mRNA-degrading endonuclease YafQ of YafQ-DinJ toxin-antitoxin module
LVSSLPAELQKSCPKSFRIRGENFPGAGKLIKNPFDASLKTHKLHGKLRGLWACQIDYDCRIVFAFEKSLVEKENLIILVDIGKHDEVY